MICCFALPYLLLAKKKCHRPGRGLSQGVISPPDVDDNNQPFVRTFQIGREIYEPVSPSQSHGRGICGIPALSRKRSLYLYCLPSLAYTSVKSRDSMLVQELRA